MPHSGKLPQIRQRPFGPLKVLVAPDKFKGTLTAGAAAEAIARGWRRARPGDEVQLLPISDGGDGFGAAISQLIGAREQRAVAIDAAHRETEARWWWQKATGTAVVESARVIGLAMLPPGRFHPFALDTLGLSMVLRRAFRKGAGRCLIGLGGSATNDGGFGLARGLGWRFLDENGREIKKWTELAGLGQIVKPANLELPDEVLAAVDVQNPLFGARGATRIYGPQKGIRPRDFGVAEKCLKRLAGVAEGISGKKLSGFPGAGAAGGLGFGLMAFAGARLAPGFELFGREAGLAKRLQWADLVLTGEGSIDRSTTMGKGVGQLAVQCRRLKKECIGLGGVVGETRALRTLFRELRALTGVTNEQEAKARAGFWLEELAFQTARQMGMGMA